MSEFSDFLYAKYTEKNETNRTSIRSLARKIGMSHNYLCQILYGKVSAPEGVIQQKLAKELIPKNEQKRFYDLAAKDRNDIPVDIKEKITKYNNQWDEIREVIERKNEK